MGKNSKFEYKKQTDLKCKVMAKGSQYQAEHSYAQNNFSFTVYYMAFCICTRKELILSAQDRIGDENSMEAPNFKLENQNSRNQMNFLSFFFLF